MGLLEDFNSVIFFKYTYIYLPLLEFGQFWKIKAAFLVWKLVGSME